MRATNQERIHIQQLQWAILFSQMDLEKFSQMGVEKRQEILARVKRDLYEFVRASNQQGTASDAHQVGNVVGDPQYFTGGVSGERLKRIQDEFKKALSAFADESFFSLALNEKASGRVRFHWVAFTPYSRFGQGVNVPEDPLSQSVLAIGLHVAHSGLTGEQIRRCPRPECGKIFIRERKPREGIHQYCSTNCTQAVSTKKYRAKKSAEAGQKRSEVTKRKSGSG